MQKSKIISFKGKVYLKRISKIVPPSEEFVQKRFEQVYEENAAKYAVKGEEYSPTEEEVDEMKKEIIDKISFKSTQLLAVKPSKLLTFIQNNIGNIKVVGAPIFVKPELLQELIEDYSKVISKKLPKVEDLEIYMDSDNILLRIMSVTKEKLDQMVLAELMTENKKQEIINSLGL